MRCRPVLYWYTALQSKSFLYKLFASPPSVVCGSGSGAECVEGNVPPKGAHVVVSVVASEEIPFTSPVTSEAGIASRSVPAAAAE